MNRRFLYLVVALLLALVALASAEAPKPSYTLGVTSATDAPCQQAWAVARWYLDQLDTRGEIITLVCDDQQFAAFTKKLGVDTDNALSVQDKAGNWRIFIRAKALLGDVRSNRGFTPAHILAHELGHVRTNCRVEEAADEYAARIVPSLKPYPKG